MILTKGRASGFINNLELLKKIYLLSMNGFNFSIFDEKKFTFFPNFFAI
jgi:hypothetical protein